MSGERLDSLSELARVELPAWGPWSLRGPIRMSATGYEVQGLTLNVGRSRLGGSGTLDVSGPRPRLQMQVAAPTPPARRLPDAAAPDRPARVAGAGRRYARRDHSRWPAGSTGC